MIHGIQKDKLIVALQMEDAVRAINTAMRARKMKFTLDFAEKDHLARLYAEMPGIEREGIMVVNPKTKFCVRVNAAHPDLAAALNDINIRLQSFEAGYVLAADKPPNKKRHAALQLHFRGARKIVLTLMSANEGQVKSDTEFKLPDGTVP